MKNLPPLKAVRAFEACYRLRSFTRAASSLNVQQPAISHQIRLLEKDLGVRLFVKQGAFINPTSVADDYYMRISRALGEIATASERLRQTWPNETLTLATYPGIAAFWVLPRIEKMRASHPGIDIKVTTSELDGQIPFGEADCTILFGFGKWPGMNSVRLMGEKVVPIASPRLAGQFGNMSAAEFLSQAPLINLEDPEKRWIDWQDWCAAQAPGCELKRPRISVTNHGVAIHQALMGYGVALGWIGIIDELLEQRALAALDYPGLKTRRGYYLVYPAQFEKNRFFQPLCKIFTD